MSNFHLKIAEHRGFRKEVLQTISTSTINDCQQKLSKANQQLTDERSEKVRLKPSKNWRRRERKKRVVVSYGHTFLKYEKREGDHAEKRQEAES
jgi:hypothetical protein